MRQWRNMENFPHIITEEDLKNHADIFPVDAIIGMEIQLSENDYAELGLELHRLTEEDLQTNESFTRLGLIVGDLVEIPIADDSDETPA